MSATRILTEMIRRGELVTNIELDPSDIDDVLDLRDGPDFDPLWGPVFDAVKAAKVGRDLTDATYEAELLKLREVAYLAAFDMTRSPEFAGYLSDDFWLLGDALWVEHEDAWLNALFLEYKNGRFPRGKLTPVSGKLSELLPGE